MLDGMVLIASLPVIDSSKHIIRLSNVRSVRNRVKLMFGYISFYTEIENVSLDFR